jgi:hypothetical protein
LLESEIAKVDETTRTTRAGARETDLARRELLRETRSLEAAASVLEGAIGRLETKTRSLVETLPPPIVDRVEPLHRRIPTGSATDLTLGERFQNVIGILNEVNKFTSDVTLVNELVTLPGGESAEVRALYLGLAQAYYVTADGTAAGIGRPSPSGWNWTPADDIAADVTRAIAILENEIVPAYVLLPVEIQ